MSDVGGTRVNSSHAAWIERGPAKLDGSVGRIGQEGFTLAVKANIAAHGWVQSAGCAALARQAASFDAPIVAALRAAGGEVAGTTNMHELAFGVTTQNPVYGNTEVPGFPGFSAGGSSGGSAAVVAAGEAVMALGTDTGGSVTIPASLCGVTGFRPSTGRWPTAGVVGLSWTRDTPGVFARKLEQVTAAHRIVAGRRGPVGGQEPTAYTLGILPEHLQRLDPRTAEAWRRAADRLGEACRVVEVDNSDMWGRAGGAAADIMGWETPRELAASAARVFERAPAEAFEHLWQEIQSNDVRGVLQGMLDAPVSASAYEAAQLEVMALRAEADRLHQQHRIDAWVFPATPAPAPPTTVGTRLLHGGREEDTFELYTRNAQLGTLVGAPMVTLPLPVAPGELPVGLTLQGARHDDDALLVLARTCARLVESSAV